MNHSAYANDRLIPPAIVPEQTLRASEWGMASFLLSEVAFFATLIVTYVAFMGRDVIGPTPAEALSLPLVLLSTVCLLLSSAVIHAAERAFERGSWGSFCALWAVTIVLGIVFLALTGIEWHDLIARKHLTISRNLFGTTYFTLVGFHALHVSIGVVAMFVIGSLVVTRKLSAVRSEGVKLVAWYWHFVDAVWIVVFLVVYVASRSVVA